MKKTLIWILMAVFAITFSIAGAGCKVSEAVEEAVEEVEEAVEEAVEEEMEEESADTTFDGKPWSEVKVGYVMPYLEGWFFYWDIGFKVPMAANNIYAETILTYWDPEAELQGVRDFITKGYDAISLQTASPDVA